MKIRCDLKYYIEEKEANRHDKYSTFTHFKFQVWILQQEIKTKYDYTDLVWEEKELLKESPLIKLDKEEDKEKESYFYFNGMSWTYFHKQQNLYIANKDIEV